MNFHVFVAIVTVLFYIVLRFYKSNILSKEKKSNLIYVLFVPCVLYVWYYMNDEGNVVSIIKSDTAKSYNIDIKSESLLTMPFPESSSLLISSSSSK